MDRADLLVLQYPMWWHLPPAMLKGWFDRVLVYGTVYTSATRFENGRFAGKRAMLSVTVGTSRATYEHDGRCGDIDLLLWPVNFTLAYVGYEILAPFVSYGVEAGLRYTRPLRSRSACGPSSRTSARRYPAWPSGRPSRSTEWKSGGRTAASPLARGPLAVRPAQEAARIGVNVALTRRNRILGAQAGGVREAEGR